MSTTSYTKARDFLENHKVAVLSTVSEKGEAWGAAIYYVIDVQDDQFVFYFFTHVDSQKYRNIQQHSQVALTVLDDYQQATVQTSGKISEVPMGDELDAAYRKLTLVHPPGQFSWVPPVSKIHDQGAIILLKFVPKKMQLSYFKPDKPEGGDSSVARII